MFKKLFGGGSGSPSDAEYTIEDLIVLERYDDAEAQLQAKVKKNPHDLYAHLKLAEIHVVRKQWLKAIDEFSYVADCYADDGFYDKGIAILAKAAKLAPLDEGVQKRIARLQALKRLEHSRSFFIDALGMMANRAESPLDRLSPVEIQSMWKRLGPTRFFLALPGEQLKRLIAEMSFRTFAAGLTIASRHGTDRVLYLLVSGTVEAILEQSQGDPISLRNFTSGDLLGEWPLLEQRPWPATLLARDEVQTLVLGREGLEKALLGNPDPRGLLDALRSQRNDQELAMAIRRLEAPR